MIRHGVRRWIALCTVLALMLGLAVQGTAMGNMGAKIAAAAAGNDKSRPSGDCDGCRGGVDGMATLMCYAGCAVTVADLPSVTPLKTVANEQPIAVAAVFDPGRGISPDPHPPRPPVLS